MACRQLARLATFAAAAVIPCISFDVPVNIPVLHSNQIGDREFHVGRLARRGAVRAITVPEEFDGGFWFGNFIVGSSETLSLLIDTGSKDVAVNPGLYRPSSGSQNLNKNASMHYWSTESDGCGEANISFALFSDRVSVSDDLAVPGQTFAFVTESAVADMSGVVTHYPGDGVCGFGQTGEDDVVGGPSFMQSLCNLGKVPECRFGLALGTNGRGQQVLGGVNNSLYQGRLVEAAVQSQWEMPASVTVGGLKLMGIEPVVMVDSGASGIIGPPDQIRALFDAAGMQTEERHLPGCATVLVGYYNCTEPPEIGFSFDGGVNVFNVEPQAMQLADNGGNNCTAAISGIDSGAWVLGQAWFQGKYIDFNLDRGSIGVAELVKKGGHSCSEFQCAFPNLVYDC